MLAWSLVPALALAGPVAVGGDGSKSDNARLLPGVYPAVPVDAAPQGDQEPFFDIDWASSLRGSYSRSGERESFEVLLVPSVALSHEGRRSQIEFSGEAEITQPLDNEIDVTGLRLGFEGAYGLDSVTALEANATFELEQDLPGSPGLRDDVAVGPQEISGSLELGATRQFGRFNVGVTGEIGRETYGDTEMVDGSLIDNSGRDLWTLDAGLRVGFQATPIFEVFGEAGLGREIFDRPSSALLIRTDATNRTIRGGVVGRWNEVLEAQASVGVGVRQFDEASLGEVTSRLYDARLIFTPDPTWRFEAALSTDISPPAPDEAGLTRVRYEATGEVGYTVNSWLDLRALAEWRLSRIDDGAEDERGFGYGVGADYKINAHTDLSADYAFDRSEDVVDGREDSHRVTLGITLAR